MCVCVCVCVCVQLFLTLSDWIACHLDRSALGKSRTDMCLPAPARGSRQICVVSILTYHIPFPLPYKHNRSSCFKFKVCFV